MNNRLYKKEKLCSVTAIDRLFGVGGGRGRVTADSKGRVGVALCYPLRMVFGENNGRGGARVQFLVSVPKRRLRRAVDRVKMRRRVREAYRLSPFRPHEIGGLPNNELGGLPNIDVAFVYVASEVVSYARVSRAMDRLLPQLVFEDNPGAEEV